MQTVFSTAKPVSKVKGPVVGVGQYLSRTRALGPPVWPIFKSYTPNGPLVARLGPPDGEAISINLLVCCFVCCMHIEGCSKEKLHLGASLSKIYSKDLLTSLGNDYSL